MNLLPEPLVKALKKQKYQLLGEHSAVKKCRWLHQSLVYERFCYKSQFYGIKSHCCLQMTPTIASCTMSCRFCWRIQPDDVSIQWNQLSLNSWDEPEAIVDGCIRAQRKILSGYKAQVIDGKLKKVKYEEALNPRHVAISLAGEPTLYPNLGELLREFHSRRLTTFLVTNGTVPNVLQNLQDEPSQLYVSLCAPDEKTFEEVCRPQIPDAWQKLNATLELLPSFNCPTVVRLTLVRNLNLKDPENYAKLVRKSQSTHIEPKAYVFVGLSRNRLAFENMPTHQEIKFFATKLEGFTGYKILDESVHSRVVLLSRLEKPKQWS